MALLVLYANQPRSLPVQSLNVYIGIHSVTLNRKLKQKKCCIVGPLDDFITYFTSRFFTDQLDSLILKAGLLVGTFFNCPSWLSKLKCQN